MKKGLHELLSQLYRNHFGKMVAVLTFHTGIEEIALAEDIVQEAFTAATLRWQYFVPDNPEAWLYKTIRNIALNRIKKEKRNKTFDSIEIDNASEHVSEQDLLRVLFACLQPAFSPKVQLVVTLRYVCGLKIKRLAALLATTEEAITKLLYRWRAQIKPDQLTFTETLAEIGEQKTRMALKVLYVMFTEGYQLSDDGTLTGESLCEDALSLLQEMMKLGINASGDTQALYALMLYNLARANSRTNQLNELIILAEQDRSLWNRDMIAVANHYLSLSQKESPAPSAFKLEAAIAYKHTEAVTFDETDWTGIAQLYEKLLIFSPSPFTRLGQAAALYFGGNEAAAVQILGQLQTNPFFQQYHLLHCFLGRIADDRHDFSLALAHYKKALACPTTGKMEREFIVKISSCDNH